MINQWLRQSVLFISLFLSQVFARAQSYNIKTFEGDNATIKLTYKVLTTRTLAVSYLKDTLFLDDYMFLDKVQVYGKFLQITYDIRGGSGLGLISTLILSIIKGEINVAMHVTSGIELVSPDKERTYKLKFKRMVEDNNRYKMLVGVHDEHRSRLHPQTNYTKDQRVTLMYDSSQNIFYGTHEDIADSFSVYDLQKQQWNRQEVKGAVPVITLGEVTYYYIKEEWYKRYDDTLVKYAYRKI